MSSSRVSLQVAAIFSISRKKSVKQKKTLLQTRFPGESSGGFGLNRCKAGHIRKIAWLRMLSDFSVMTAEGLPVLNIPFRTFFHLRERQNRVFMQATTSC